jgi:glycosyltransferase involved in cell wall biosynthesis
MNIAYIANPKSIHDCKWINVFSTKYNVIVVCSELDNSSLYLNERVKVYPILTEFPYKNILKRNKVLSALRDIIENESIDIIHSMYAFPNAFWVNLIQFKNHIITTRGSDVLVDYRNLFKHSNSFTTNITNKFFIKQFHNSFNNAKYITSTSIIQQLVIKEFLKNEKKLKLIRTGIDIDDFIKIAEKIHKTEKELIIFSPRSMMPIYNIDIIVNAFSLVIKKHSNIKLVIINDVPNEEYATTIVNLIAKLGIKENCIVTNKLSKKEMIRWYVNADLVVSIPKTDGSPNSVLEAMLAKKSLIMGDYDYDSQLFLNIPKLKANTKEGLFVKMDELLNKPILPEILEKNYNLVIQLANLKNSTEKIDQLYMDLLQPKRHNKRDKPHALFIAAWYPHQENKTHGNFIKEHAKAVSLFAKVSVVFIRFNKTSGIPRIDIDKKTDGLLNEYFITINSPVRRFEVHDLLIKSAYKKVIKKIEDEQEIDICHINVRDIYTESILDLKELDFPIVVTEHFSHYHTGIYQLTPKEQKIEIQKIKRWFSDSRIKYIMPVSKQLGNVLVDNFEVDKAKIIDIPNVADNCFSFEEKNIKEIIKIVLVANWHEPKNPILFLKALTKISPKMLNNVEIDWIGEGTQINKVKKFANANLHELNINFWGTQTKQFIADKFREASFFVHPTDAENLPTVIIESLCCGTPVITHNVNGIPELINKLNGVMCKVGDVDDFKNKFIKMLGNYMKYDNAKIAEAAQKRFYVEPISLQLKKVYIDVLKQDV